MAAFTTIFMLITALRYSISVHREDCNYGVARPYFQKSIYDFTLEIVKRINIETESHFVTSALTPWTLLLVMSLGGSEATREQIRKVLQLNPNRCLVYLYLELINEVTMKPDQPASSRLERSSTIFFNASEKTDQLFFDYLSKVGIYSSRIMYFVDLNETARSINEHVRSFTDEFMKKIVSPKDLDGITALTVDAMTFRGAWKVPFPYEDTDTEPFYKDDGEHIGDVSLMYGCASYSIIPVSQIKAQVLEMPYYGDDSRFSMLIFLPEQNTSLTTMIDLMDSINISTLFKSIDQSSPEKITVQIPRFKITSSFSHWKDFFMDMGLNAIFQEQDSKFSSTSYYQLFLTNFMQQAELEVIEEGMEIGRATAMLMQSRFMYDDFVANKPFLFMIINRIQLVPVITGAYSNPTFYEEEVN